VAIIFHYEGNNPSRRYLPCLITKTRR